MNLFVTDNNSIFENNSSDHKLYVANSCIKESKGFDKKTILAFNQNLNAIENQAAEDMIAELKKIAKLAPALPTNKYLQTRQNNYAIAYSFLYPNFKQFVLKARILELLLHSFLAAFKEPPPATIELNLSDEFLWIEKSVLLQKLNARFTFRKKTRSDFSIPPLKNLLYGVYHKANMLRRYKPADGEKKHVALFIYDTANDISLFNHFVSQCAASDKIKLSVVQLSSGIPLKERVDAKIWKGAGDTDIYYFKDFKTYVKPQNSAFYEWAESIDPAFRIFRQYKINDNLSQYYAYAAHAIQVIKPDVTLYDNTGEVGRVISDVSRYFKIPSVNVEYGLFTDDALHMESCIQFSARACLGTESAQLWKRRNDPTPLHIPIGFLKLDELKTMKFDREAFYKKHGLDPHARTILFASTWSAINTLYNSEKAIIIKELCGICKKQGWNLLIKKHPSESDRHANDAANEVDHGLVKVLEHNQVNLYEALSYADAVTTQFSGVSVEALYYKKPILFINLSEKSSWADYSLMKNEPYVRSLSNLHAVENTLLELFAGPQALEDDFEAGIRKYLFSEDGKAGERLIKLLTEIKT